MTVDTSNTSEDSVFLTFSINMAVLTYRHELGMNYNFIRPDLIVGSCLQVVTLIFFFSFSITCFRYSELSDCRHLKMLTSSEKLGLRPFFVCSKIRTSSILILEFLKVWKLNHGFFSVAVKNSECDTWNNPRNQRKGLHNFLEKIINVTVILLISVDTLGSTLWPYKSMQGSVKISNIIVLK